MSEEEKKIQSFKRYIISQENKLEEYYNLDDSDDSYYKDEIQELELTIPLLKYILNLIEKQQKEIEELEKYKRKHSLVKNHYVSKNKIRDKIKELENMRDTSITSEAFNIFNGEIIVLKELIGDK